MHATGWKKRHQLKYERRKYKRLQKRQQRLIEFDFDTNMYDMRNWIIAWSKSRQNVAWKTPVILYGKHPILNSTYAIDQIKKGKYPYPINTERLVITERGKSRFIEPIKIAKRHGEHVFCDNIFLPYFQAYLIYDNGASQAGKGTDFSKRRTLKMLEQAVRKWGDNFYIWQFDFKSFFDSINLAMCNNILDQNFINNERSIWFAMNSLTEYYYGNIILEKDLTKKQQMEQALKDGTAHGICLGSQISQNTAILFPSKLDHFIKDQCAIKFYNRYMDDGLVLHNSKKVLQELQNKVIKICELLKLNFNIKKTHITKATRPFVFLKIKYRIQGKRIIRTPHRSGIVRIRRKLKRFYKLIQRGEMTLEKVFQSFHSVYNFLKRNGHSYFTRLKLVQLWQSLFGNYNLWKLDKRYAKFKT